jgi:hypothetical protein
MENSNDIKINNGELFIPYGDGTDKVPDHINVLFTIGSVCVVAGLCLVTYLTEKYYPELLIRF